VVLSEFGGVAFADDPGWGYDSVATPDELVGRVADLWETVRESEGLAGGCWTQLTDTYQEVNGLLRFDRSPKAPLEAFHQAVSGRRR
jgi:hypothetical protein